MLDGRARLDVARLDPGELQLLTVAGLDADLLEQVGLQAVHASAQEKMTAVATRGQVLGTPPLSEVLLIDPSGWFTTGKELGLLTAARERRRIRLCYRRSGETSGQWLTADPYGLVNKAGSWYLVADVDGHPPHVQHQPYRRARSPHGCRGAPTRLRPAVGMARPGDQLRADPRRRGACAAALNPPGPGPTNSRNPHGQRHLYRGCVDSDHCPLPPMSNRCDSSSISATTSAF